MYYAVQMECSVVFRGLIWRLQNFANRTDSSGVRRVSTVDIKVDFELEAGH